MEKHFFLLLDEFHQSVRQPQQRIRPFCQDTRTGWRVRLTHPSCALLGVFYRMYFRETQIGTLKRNRADCVCRLFVPRVHACQKGERLIPSPRLRRFQKLSLQQWDASASEEGRERETRSGEMHCSSISPTVAIEGVPEVLWMLRLN